MKKTLTCTCGHIVSYGNGTKDAENIDKLFRSNHAGEGHEVTEKPTYICDEEEW